MGKKIRVVIMGFFINFMETGTNNDKKKKKKREIVTKKSKKIVA